MKKKISIIGGGLAGMIAANFFKNSVVYESGPRRETHKALLRFRTPAVSEMIGIPFERVSVHKGIFLDGGFVSPNIMIANMYSMKVAQTVVSRSIWNIEKCDRFVAPEDLVSQMQEDLSGRMNYDSTIFSLSDERIECGLIVSTAPISVNCRLAGIAPPRLNHGKIHTIRFRVNGANVHQTVYYPGRETPAYRASIVKDMMIVEITDRHYASFELVNWDYIASSFGLSPTDMELIEESSQAYGKISPMDERERRSTIHRLTLEHGVYSLGRFATWRQVLLDDLVQDMSSIRTMMNMDNYDLHKR